MAKRTLAPVTALRTVPLVLAVCALIGGAGLLLRTARSDLEQIAATGGRELTPLVEVSAVAALALVLAWLAVVTVACTVQVLRGRPRPQVAPRVVYRVVCILLGLGLGLTPVAANAAATTPAPTASSSVVLVASADGGTDSMDPGWGSAGPESTTSGTSAPSSGATGSSSPTTTSPTTTSPTTGSSTTGPTTTGPTSTGPSATGPTSTGPTTTGPTTTSPTPTTGGGTPASPSTPGARTAGGGADQAIVVVHRGDTLWDIAARELGDGASAAEIAREWPRWYQTNRDVIGSDPDLILPGQQLQRPA